VSGSPPAIDSHVARLERDAISPRAAPYVSATLITLVDRLAARIHHRSTRLARCRRPISSRRSRTTSASPRTARCATNPYRFRISPRDRARLERALLRRLLAARVIALGATARVDRHCRSMLGRTAHPRCRSSDASKPGRSLTSHLTPGSQPSRREDASAFLPGR